MSAVHRRGNAVVRASMTPMIDVTFLLIVFFVLVSQIVEVENVDMELPAPKDPVTQPPGEQARAVVNVIPGGAGRAEGYRIGGRTYAAGAAGLEPLTAHLAALYRANPALDVNVRADRLTHYAFVEPVMQAVSAAAARVSDAGEAGVVVPRVNLVVVREE